MFIARVLLPLHTKCRHWAVGFTAGGYAGPMLYVAAGHTLSVEEVGGFVRRVEQADA